MLSATSQEIQRFQAAALINHGRADQPIIATERRKYIALDRDNSGLFLVDRQTAIVYAIRGYGQRGERIGSLSNLIAQYEAANATYATR